MKPLNLVLASLLLVLAIGCSNNLLAQNETADQFKESYANALKDAENSAIKNAAGQITQFEIQPLFEPAKQLVQLGYDNNGRPSSITDSKGNRVDILRNANGEVEGFAFPNGDKTEMIWNESGNLAGFEVTYANGTKITKTYQESGLLAGPTGDPCTRAINAAGYAATAAVVACGLGPTYSCAIAVGAAALAAYHAHQICSE